MEEQFNGWTNRETWATALYIDNDQGLLETVNSLAEAAYEDNQDDSDTALYELQVAIEDLFDDIAGDYTELSLDAYNMLRDIGSLYRVNWREVARSYLYEQVSA